MGESLEVTVEAKKSSEQKSKLWNWLGSVIAGGVAQAASLYLMIDNVTPAKLAASFVASCAVAVAAWLTPGRMKTDRATKSTKEIEVKE